MSALPSHTTPEGISAGIDQNIRPQSTGKCTLIPSGSLEITKATRDPDLEKPMRSSTFCTSKVLCCD